MISFNVVLTKWTFADEDLQSMLRPLALRFMKNIIGYMWLENTTGYCGQILKIFEIHFFNANCGNLRLERLKKKPEIYHINHISTKYCS